MPAKPARWCPRCTAIHADACPNKPAWVKKPFAKSGRGGSKWRRIREEVFERDEYLCQECRRQGLITGVELHGVGVGICDHIVPLAEGGAEFDADNLQTLCKTCHDRKTHEESLRGRGVKSSADPI